MKGLVVYHTKFGHGKSIAEAIAKGLEETGHEVTVTDAGARDVGGDFDFVVVGSPTRMGRMMGPAKRFIKGELSDASWKGKPFIAVGTGFRPKGTAGKFDEYGARSAEQVYEALEKQGLKPLMEPQKFFVEDMKGPLEDGEESRALELGRSAGQELSEASTS